MAEREIRIDPADELQIRLLMRVPPEQRIRVQLGAQEVVLGQWRRRLRRAYPQLSDVELTRLLYERLGHHGIAA